MLSISLIFFHGVGGEEVDDCTNKKGALIHLVIYSIFGIFCVVLRNDRSHLQLRKNGINGKLSKSIQW